MSVLLLEERGSHGSRLAASLSANSVIHAALALHKAGFERGADDRFSRDTQEGFPVIAVPFGTSILVTCEGRLLKPPTQEFRALCTLIEAHLSDTSELARQLEEICQMLIEEQKTRHLETRMLNELLSGIQAELYQERDYMRQLEAWITRFENRIPCLRWLWRSSRSEGRQGMLLRGASRRIFTATRNGGTSTGEDF